MADNANSGTVDFRKTIDGFVKAFNVYDLDATMRYFAEDAVYRPGDGSEHCGLAAIRAAFEPQFAYAWGFMRFDEHDRLVDEAARKVAIRWICRHDLAGAKFYSWSHWVQRLAVSLSVGKRAGWEGLDVFHFNAEGKIVGKFTYANYSRPQLRKELGVSLASEASSARTAN